jgi:hypothetical protein
LTPVNNFSAVLLTPLNNIRSRLSREFSKKIKTIPKAYSGARGTLIYEKKPEVENFVSDSLEVVPCGCLLLFRLFSLTGVSNSQGWAIHTTAKKHGILPFCCTEWNTIMIIKIPKKTGRKRTQQAHTKYLVTERRISYSPKFCLRKTHFYGAMNLPKLPLYVCSIILFTFVYGQAPAN